MPTLPKPEFYLLPSFAKEWIILKEQHNKRELLMVTCWCPSTVSDIREEVMIVDDKVDRSIPGDTKFFGISLIHPVF